MKRKWRNAFIVMSVVCALVVAYFFVLPFLVQNEMKNLNNVEIEYNGKIYKMTNTEQLSHLQDHLNTSEWERVFDDYNANVPEIYIAINNRYLLSFTPNSNQGHIRVSLCFLKSNIIVSNYIMSVQQYNRLVSFLDSIEN